MNTAFSCSSCDRDDLCERCFIDLNPCHQPGTCTALVCRACQPNLHATNESKEQK